MENLIEFIVLGPFEASRTNGGEIEFGHRKAQALLAYLAIEGGRAQPREHLATLLWGRTGEDRARHNLRQALSKLRTLCPDLVDTPGDGILLNPDACRIDVQVFEELARSDDPADLQQALELYRGDLLEGYSTREPGYQDWLELVRNRLRKQARDAASQLAAKLCEQGRHKDAIDVLNRLLRLDPADESAHRELMGLLARSGRRTEALRQYQECVAALARALDTEPGVETKRLHAEIKAGQRGPSAGATPAATQIGDAAHKRPSRQPPTTTLYVAAADTELAPEALHRCIDLIVDGIGDHHGQVVQRRDDSVLAHFEQAADAVRYGLALQGSMQDTNGGRLADCGTLVRIGIGRADSLDGDANASAAGDGIAMRLEALVERGAICVSGSVRDAVQRQVQAGFVFIGEQQVQNLATPVRAYRLAAPDQPQSICATRALNKPALALPSPGKPSLIIKPFVNMSSDAGQDYFAEGLTKDISIALTKIPGLFLAADESPTAQVSQRMTAPELGRAVGVRYVLAGGVRRHGERVRVNAELVDAATGQCLWGERFDRNLDDLFSIQDEITEEIVTAMDVKLIQGEAARFMRKALTKPAALEASYRGWYALYHGSSRQDVHEAQQLFEEVIRLEPESPLGYASAALAYWAEAGFGRVVVHSAAMEHAAELARKALGLRDTTGYAHLVMALVHLAHREFDKAMAQATEGVATRPSCNGAYAIKASVLNYLGRPNEAIEFAQYAVRLTPLYPAEFPAILAAAYHDSGRYADAIAAANASLQLRNDDIDPLLILAAAQVALGSLDEAQRNAGKVQALEPTFRLTAFARTQPYQNPQDLEILIRRLREAGLPD